MSKKIFILIITFLLTSVGKASAQSMRALSNGFSVSRSTGISSSFLQLSNSEANLIIDILTQNVNGDSSGYARAIPDENYSIENVLDPFSIVINRNSNSGGSSETRINNSVFSGHNHSIFMQ